jgi:trigger factor
VRSSFLEAVESENLRLVGEPEIGRFEAEAGKGVSYTATFEVYPEVEVCDPGNLKVQTLVCDITEADIDIMVETLRRRQRTWEPVERSAQKGDQLDIDFQGYVDEEPLEDGEAKGFTFELGSSDLLEGFEAGLIGANALDELTLNLEFASDYHKKDLAGKPVRFEIQVNKVLEPRLPDLDEDLFRQFGVEEGGLQAFRDEVRKTMERERDQQVRKRVKQRVMDALLDANSVVLPKVLVDRETESLRRQIDSHVAPQSKDRAESQTIPLLEKEARRRVELGLILAEIINRNGLRADPARVRKFIDKIAASYNQPSAVVKWYYDDRKRLAEVENTVLEDQVTDWVLERAQVQELPISFDALMNPRQTEDHVKGNA